MTRGSDDSVVTEWDGYVLRIAERIHPPLMVQVTGDAVVDGRVQWVCK